MIYNNEEKQKIRDGLVQIREYVTQNCVPRLRKGESVSVKSGPYRFGFEDDGKIWFRRGDLVLRFREDDPLRYSGCCGDLYILNNLGYGAELLLNWFDVKCRINTALDDRDRIRKAIINFEI